MIGADAFPATYNISNLPEPVSLAVFGLAQSSCWHAVSAEHPEREKTRSRGNCSARFVVGAVRPHSRALRTSRSAPAGRPTAARTQRPPMATTAAVDGSGTGSVEKLMSSNTKTVVGGGRCEGKIRRLSRELTHIAGHFYHVS